MPKNIQKSIQKYISKIKKQAPHLQISHSTLSSTTSKILKGCKHPKSLSFSLDYHHKGGGGKDNRRDKKHESDEAATLEDIDKFLVENFKSLYGLNENKDDKEKEQSDSESEYKSESESSDAHYDESPRMFTPNNINSLRGSHSFLTSPASSGSLPEEARVISGTGTSSPIPYDIGTLRNHNKHNNKSPISEGMEDCITILTVSPNPHEEFKRSMQEVLYARTHNNQTVDWDFMEELLFCYLRLNPKKQHRFIFSAFVDLIVVLRQNSSNGGPNESRSSNGDKNDAKGKKRRD